MPKYNFQPYSIQNFQTNENYIVLHDSVQNAAFIVGKIDGSKLYTAARLKKLNLHKRLQRDPHFPAENKQTAANIKQRSNGIFKIKFDPQRLRADSLTSLFKLVEINPEHDSFFQTIRANVMKTFGAANISFSTQTNDVHVNDNSTESNTNQLTSSSSYTQLSMLSNTPTSKDEIAATSELSNAELQYNGFNQLVKEAGRHRAEIDRLESENNPSNLPRINHHNEKLSQLNTTIVKHLALYKETIGSEQTISSLLIDEWSKTERSPAEQKVLVNIQLLEHQKFMHNKNKNSAGVKIDTSTPNMPPVNSPYEQTDSWVMVPESSDNNGTQGHTEPMTQNGTIVAQTTNGDTYFKESGVIFVSSEPPKHNELPKNTESSTSNQSTATTPNTENQPSNNNNDTTYSNTGLANLMRWFNTPKADDDKTQPNPSSTTPGSPK